MEKKSKLATIVLILLTSTMLLTVLSQNIMVNAQDDEATVVVLSSVGGTTNPAQGTYNYANGTPITLIATPNQGFEFLYWIISGTYVTHNQPPLIIPELYVNDPDWVPDLPQPDSTGIDNVVLTQERLDIICGYGYTYTYQAVFAPTELSSTETNAIVIVADAIGGTTNLGPGTYTYPEGQTITLTATPDAGFEFLYWVISGNYRQGHNQQPVILPEQFADDPSFVPDLPRIDITGIDSLVSTQSRLDIICGYGYTYTYQPVFTPISADVPQPGEQPQIPEQPEPETPEQPESPHPLGLSNEAITILIAILAIVVIIAIGFAAYIYMKNRK